MVKLSRGVELSLIYVPLTNKPLPASRTLPLNILVAAQLPIIAKAQGKRINFAPSLLTKRPETAICTGEAWERLGVQIEVSVGLRETKGSFWDLC